MARVSHCDVRFAIVYGVISSSGYWLNRPATSGCRDRRSDPGRGRRLHEAPVHDHRRVGVHCSSPSSSHSAADRHRLRHRRALLRPDRLHRHVRLGPRQRAHHRGRQDRHRQGPERRLQGRRHHRHAGGRSRPARRGRLLPDPAETDAGAHRSRTWSASWSASASAAR